MGKDQKGKSTMGNDRSQLMQEDLLSTALLYVLDELSPHERLHFESRLVEDQAAREAVADAVALCQTGKRAVDSIMQNCALRNGVMQFAESAASLPGADCDLPKGIKPVQLALWHDRLWRTPVAKSPVVWAAMAMAASLVAAVALTGLRESPFGHKTSGSGSAGIVAHGAQSSASDSMASEHTDRGGQLAVAWLNFLPTSNATTRDVDVDVPGSDLPDVAEAGTEHDALMADEQKSFTLPGASIGDEDIIASVDAAMQASDWVFEAVTAEPIPSASVNPREG
jgi:hypothetical protein